MSIWCRCRDNLYGFDFFRKKVIVIIRVILPGWFLLVTSFQIHKVRIQPYQLRIKLNQILRVMLAVINVIFSNSQEAY